MKTNLMGFMMSNLIVEKKNVYGVERVFPVCNKAKLFARISGNKTLLPEDIELIKKDRKSVV